MSSNDYVRYLTERIVGYWDLPREQRRALRQRRRYESWHRRYLGDIPFAFNMFWQRHLARFKRKNHTSK